MKINIRFVIAKNKIRQDNKAPLFCRLTYLAQRKQFATGLFVLPKQWINSEQKLKPPNEENTFINTQLSLIKNKINQAFLFLQVQESEFTVNDIYAQYENKPTTKNIGLIEHYKSFLEGYHKLIGMDIQQITWNKFKYIYKDVKNFIKWKYKSNDVLLKDLDYSFIFEFELFLKIEKKQKQITINKSLQRFKKVIRKAVNDKLIDSFPFTEHKPKKVNTKIIYLTTEELSRLEKHQFAQSRLQQVADMFIFCCYTGLAYNEMANLQSKHIIKGFDGNDWIKMVRQKTNKEISIPLLPKSANIINKYLGHNNSSYLLPIISNQKFNSYMKEIAEVIGVEKNLSHHIARKTFATTVLLYNDVPMEIVSELLGHSNMNITQEHYAKVVQKKVSEHMASLGEKLN